MDRSHGQNQLCTTVFAHMAMSRKSRPGSTSRPQTPTTSKWFIARFMCSLPVTIGAVSGRPICTGLGMSGMSFSSKLVKYCMHLEDRSDSDRHTVPVRMLLRSRNAISDSQRLPRLDEQCPRPLCERFLCTEIIHGNPAGILHRRSDALSVDRRRLPLAGSRSDSGVLPARYARVSGKYEGSARQAVCDC